MPTTLRPSASFLVPPTFLGLTRAPSANGIAIAGVPFDLGTSNRSGPRFGPHAVRLASRLLIDGANPADWHDPKTFDVGDVGDLALVLGDTEKSLQRITAQAAQWSHVAAIGGDHTVTLALLRALMARIGPVGLIHFDAHVDTWPGTGGQDYWHGSVFYHAIREHLIDPRRTIQIGIRSPVSREVYQWTLDQGVRIVSAEDVHVQGLPAVVAAIREVVGPGATYLSFDVDALDPSQAPGTGTPEIGGLFSWQVRAILRQLGDVRWVGMDVVEVSPPYDVAEITALAAATVLWQYLCLAGQPA